MVKKLLFLPILIILFLLAPAKVVGQECVATAPVVTITNTTGSATLCKDGTTTDSPITFSSNNPAAAKTYQWEVQVGSGAWNPISGATSSTLSYTNAALGSNRFRLAVTYCNNSGETEQDLIATSTQSGIITVYEKKEGKITIAASNNNICPGETVTFSTSNPGNLGATPKYSWRVNNVESGTGANFSRSDLKAGDVVQLFVTSTVPCVDLVESNIVTFTEKAGTPAIPAAFTSGETAVCPGTPQTYTVPNDNTASEYIWTLPTGWSGSSTTNSIIVTSGRSGSGTITVKAKNSCGTSEARSFAVSVKAGTPTTPGTISGTPQVCPGVTQTFSISAVTGAASYNWTLPTGWIGSSTSTSITLTPTAGTAQNGNLSVTATNDCGTSSAKTLAISVKPGTPAQPASFTSGPETLCPATQGTYTVPTVTGARQYIWTLPAGFSAPSLTTTTPSLVVTAGNSGSGNIIVKATNDCGTGTERSMAVSINPPKPVMSGNIAGSTGVCANTNNLSYSIPAIANATSYEWTVTGTGWQITSGAGTNEITVSSGSTGGTISVIAKNSCGDSASKNITIGLNPPPPVIPGAITFSDGTDKACINTAETYSFTPVQNASSYLWTLPNGSTQTSTTPSLSYTATSAGVQTLKVAAVNSCGTSDEKSVQINVAGGKPAQPGVITASKYTVCPPETGFTLTVPSSSDTDTYEWFLPAGWEITAGKGTNAITVKINASSTYQNPTVVGVEAKNHCGNSSRRNTSSDINDANAIAVSDFVYVNMGEDRLLCKSKDPISINTSLNFGGKRLRISTLRSSSGIILPVPSGNVDSHLFTYTPTDTDLANGSVTITLTTESPGGACSAGKDEIVLNFRPIPTASITVPAPICVGSSTDLTVTGTPNTVLTYGIGTGADRIVNIGSSGTTIIDTGALNTTSTFNLRSIKYADEPSCSTSLTSSTTVTVTPKPTATISYAGTPFCTSLETAQAVTLNQTGTTTDATFSAPTGLTISNTGAITPGSSIPGSYTVTYTIPASGGCEAVTATTQVQILQKVEITSQPIGDRICEGENVQFSVTATGDGLTYKWFKGTVGSGTAVAGGTSAVLNLSNVTTSNAGNYYVEVSGSSPCSKVPSQVVELLVDEDISINTQPANTATCLGGTATLTVDASAGNTALNYKWHRGTPGSGTAVGGATSATLVISEATIEHSGSYYVVIDGPEDFICEPVTSQTAVLTVRDTPTVEISGTNEICDGGNSEIYFTNGTPNAIVTYTINNGSQQTVTLDAAGEATLPTGVLNVANDAVTTYTYALVSVKYPDAPECSNTVTGSAVVTVNPTPNVDVSFENDQVTFCNDTFQGIFEPTLTGSGAYTGGVFSAEGLTVDPQTGSFTPANAAAGDYTLRYYLGEAGGCSELAATLDIKIFTSVEITSEPFPVAVCTANSTQLEMAASGDNLSYQWFKVGATSNSQVGSNSPILELNNATASTAGDYYVIVSGDNACSTVQSETVTVIVDQNIVVTQQPVNQNVCLEDNVALTVDATASGSNENIVFRWMYRPAGSNSEADWGYLTGGETGILNLNAIGLAQEGQYRAEIDGPDGYSCSIGYSEIANISVYEEPTADAGAATLEVCSTTNPISLGTDATATNHSSVQWTTSNGQGNIVNPANLTGATYVPVAADFGKTVTFTLTAILVVDGVELCVETDASDTKLITIIPQPEITSFTYAETEFCETDIVEQVPTVTGNYLENGDGEYTVEFEGNPASPLVVDPDTGAYTPNGTTPGTYDITYTFTADSQNGTCTIDSEIFTVTIGEKPSAQFTYGDAPYCSDAENPLPEAVNGGMLGNFTSTTGLVFVQGGESGRIDLAASTPGTYTVTNTVDFDGDGCQPVTFEAGITINAQPAAPGVQDVAYCLNTANVPALTATVDTGASLNWYDSVDATTALEAAPQPNTASAVTTSYWVSQTSAAGCESERAQISITINELPEVSISVENSIATSDSGNPVICFGSSIILTGNGAAEYSWSEVTESGTIDLGTSATLTVSPEVTTTYSVKGTDLNSCSSTSQITVEVDPVTVAGTLEAPDSVCINNPAGSLQLTGHVGEIIGWHFQEADSTTWNVLNNGSVDAMQNFSGLTKNTTFRATVQSGVCVVETIVTTVTIDPLPVGGKLVFSDIVTAENNGRIFMICEGATGGYLPITLSGSTGNILAWRYSINGAPWITISGDNGNYTESVLSAAQIQALDVPNTTVFRVELGSGACSPNVFSQTAILSVIPNDIEPTPVTVSDDVVCFGDQVTLSSETGYSSGIPVIQGGAFDNAGIKNHGWRFTLPNGNEFNFETNANNTNPDVWSRATPRDFPTASLTSNYGRTNQRWDAAVEDGNKGFAIVSGSNSSRMETSIFSIGAMDQAILTFDQAYNLTPGASITVEISTNGGTTYSNVLFSRSGPLASGNSASFGSGTPETRPNNKMVIDLGNYLGQNNLRVRFNYVGARTGDIWAVDAIKVPEGPKGVTIEWNDNTDPGNVIQIGTTNSVIYQPKKIGLNVFEVKTRLIFDSTGNACEVAENGETIEVFVFDKYTTNVTADYGSCGNYIAQLTATVLNGRNEPVTSYPTPDGYIGRWAIEGSATLVDSDPNDGIDAVNDPNATLSASETGTYNVSWILEPTEVDENGNLYANPEACPPVINVLDVVIEGCIALDFDGDDDVIIIEDPYSGVVSIEAWIRPERAGGTIISGPNFKITTPSAVTPNSRWYHIAVSNGKLYVDGIEKSNLALGNGVGSQTTIGAELIEGAATNFFSGWIEEVRLWKKPLTEEQIRFMMNQRLIANGVQMGEQIPMNVPGGLTYTDLAGYYRLISAEPEPLAASPVVFLDEDKPVNGLTPDRAATKVPGRLINMETNQQNTAPLPYYSDSNGLWGTDATWLRPDVWDPPHTGPIEWNIVRTSHDIQSGEKDIIVLGLMVEQNELEIADPTVTVPHWKNSGQRLEVTHYLSLDGAIDLVGESQLIQPEGSIIDSGSTGYLERDQQGTASSYNYNYWSPPVSLGPGNVDYTIAGVMKDGTEIIPQDLTFGAEYHFADGAFTTPRRVSSYWLHIFHGTATDYGSWIDVTINTGINVGEGYSMKGTSGNAAITDLQNYTFKGMPNNGDINLNIGKNQSYLIGNPYPSAIDAYQFITDHLKSGGNTNNVFNGTLYFWDHFSGKTHYLEEYIGGYAMFNLAGGVVAVSIDERINHNEDEGQKRPGQFVPVGQAFFVNTLGTDKIQTDAINGGTITFRNDHRIYQRETAGAASDESVFHSQENKYKTRVQGQEQQRTATPDERLKIWLKYKSPKGYHRQLLVTADPNASKNFDLGYDAPLIEDNVEDMYWYFNNYEFVIQGVDHLNRDQELPLGVKVKEEGTISISIEELRNIPEDMEIYIKDSVQGTYHDLREGEFKTTAGPGTANDRLKLVFSKPAPEIEEPPVDEVVEGDLEILYVNRTREIMVRNPQLYEISRIYLSNLLGQQVMVFYDVPEQAETPLPVRRFAAGVYIVKAHTENGIITKKVILE